MASMWRCLPFSDGAEEEDRERSRMAVIAARALLQNLDSDSELYNQPLSRGQVKMTGPTPDRGDSMLTLAKIKPWKFNGGVTLWISFFLASLGHAVVEYFTGVVDKMEKLEYY